MSRPRFRDETLASAIARYVDRQHQVGLTGNRTRHETAQLVEAYVRSDDAPNEEWLRGLALRFPEAIGNVDVASLLVERLVQWQAPTPQAAAPRWPIAAAFVIGAVIAGLSLLPFLSDRSPVRGVQVVPVPSDPTRSELSIVIQEDASHVVFLLRLESRGQAPYTFTLDGGAEVFARKTPWANDLLEISPLVEAQQVPNGLVRMQATDANGLVLFERVALVGRSQ